MQLLDAGLLRLRSLGFLGFWCDVFRLLWGELLRTRVRGTRGPFRSRKVLFRTDTMPYFPSLHT